MPIVDATFNSEIKLSFIAVKLQTKSLKNFRVLLPPVFAISDIYVIIILFIKCCVLYKCYAYVNMCANLMNKKLG